MASNFIRSSYLLNSRKWITQTHLFQSILIPCLVFMPIVFAEFGRLDDFAFYLWTRNDVSGVIQSGFSFGRPITSLVIAETFSKVNTIQDFSTLRLLSVICLVLIFSFAGKLYSNVNNFQFTLAVLAFITLPGLWVFVTWAQGFPHILALFFVVVGANCYMHKEKRWLFYVFSSAAIFTYQPFALLFPTILMTRILYISEVGYKRHFVRISSWLFILLLSNYWLVRLQAAPSARSNITKNYSEKFHWFVGEWVPRVTFPWNLNANLKLSFLSIILFVILATKYVIREKNLKAPILIFCMSFPGIPFLISAENWASSRAIFASNIAYFMVMFFFFLRVQLTPSEVALKDFATYIALACLLFFSVMHGYQGLVYPQVQEWSTLEQDVHLIPSGVNQISGQISYFEQSSSPVFSYDEFGVLNSTGETALLGMITLAKKGTPAEMVSIKIVTERACQQENSYLQTRTNTFILRPISGMKGCN